MAIKALSTKFQDQVVGALSDQATLDAYCMQEWGMTSAQLNSSLSCLMKISAGHAPDAEGMRFLRESAAKQYGWSKSQTDAAVRNAVNQSSPQGRIHAYLTAGGNQVDQSTFDRVQSLVQHAAHQDMALGLTERLDNSTSNHRLRDEFSGMKAPERVVNKSAQDQHLRGALERLVTGKKPVDQQTYAEKRQTVEVAREKLADRLDADVMRSKKPDYKEPTLRETLSQQHAIATVRAASEEYGFNDPVADADEAMKHIEHVVDENYDVTEDLRGL